MHNTGVRRWFGLGGGGGDNYDPYKYKVVFTLDMLSKLSKVKPRGGGGLSPSPGPLQLLSTPIYNHSYKL